MRSADTTKASMRVGETLSECNARLLRKIAQLESEAAQARYLAYHDSLTGLPNRALLFDRLEQAILQAARQHKAVGLLLLDLDRFKAVNDRFGHNGGDQLLRQVGARLLNCIRGCDTACRYGGDEFVIMLPEARGAEDVEAVKEKIRAHLLEPFRLGDALVAMGVSIGAAVFMAGAMSCLELIGAADSAMYRAKAEPVRGHSSAPPVTAPCSSWIDGGPGPQPEGVGDGAAWQRPSTTRDRGGCGSPG